MKSYREWKAEINELTAARNLGGARLIQRQQQQENPVFTQLGANLAQLVSAIAAEKPNFAKMLVYKLIAGAKATDQMQSGQVIAQIKTNIIRQLNSIKPPPEEQPEEQV